METKLKNILYKNYVGTSLINNNVLLINQSAIARKLKISQGYVSMIIAGKRHSKKYESRIMDLIKKAADELRAA